MGDLLIRNIDETTKSSLAELAEKNGRSLSDEAKALIEQAMDDTRGLPESGLSVWDALRPIFADISPEEADEYARIMDDIEADRKKDFGRPFEEFE